MGGCEEYSGGEAGNPADVPEYSVATCPLNPNEAQTGLQRGPA